MKNIRKLLGLFILFSIALFGCTTEVNRLTIVNGSSANLKVGESIQLEIRTSFDVVASLQYSSSSDSVRVTDDGLVTAFKKGQSVVTVSYQYDDLTTNTLIEASDSITINVIEEVEQISVVIVNDEQEIFIGDTLILQAVVEPFTYQEQVKFLILQGEEYAEIKNNTLTALQPGLLQIVADCNGVRSNIYELVIKDKEIFEDPYQHVTSNEFYRNYKPATSARDAMYRSQHGFMSGDITPQNEKPVTAKYQPKVNNQFVRNNDFHYSQDKNTYYIVDAYGQVVNQIYRGGGYSSLEEVAAYVLAFSDVPENYTSSKSAKPSRSPWGEYLRLNHTLFSGDVDRYPYEPILPNISGCGGTYDYYEIDLGTTGTTCDPSYPVKEYNNGKSITRGAARIVYARFHAHSKNVIENYDERYVFYTYNHYNDFQEYLNYENGWGQMFGNITGGGKLSSKHDYNPTKYVPVVNQKLTTNLNVETVFNTEVNIPITFIIDNRKYNYI